MDGIEMNVTADELAGVIDLFGALSPAELHQAIEELAFKRGEETPPLPIETAIEEYRLVAIEADGEPDGASGPDEERWLVPGPTAFPTLPSGAEDLPHILAVDSRDLDRERLAKSAERRFRADAARAVAVGDEAEIERLLDVSYDLDAWGAVDLDDVRERLDAASTEDE